MYVVFKQLFERKGFLLFCNIVERSGLLVEGSGTSRTLGPVSICCHAHGPYRQKKEPCLRQSGFEFLYLKPFVCVCVKTFHITGISRTPPPPPPDWPRRKTRWEGILRGNFCNIWMGQFIDDDSRRVDHCWSAKRPMAGTGNTGS